MGKDSAKVFFDVKIGLFKVPLCPSHSPHLCRITSLLSTGRCRSPSGRGEARGLRLELGAEHELTDAAIRSCARPQAGRIEMQLFLEDCPVTATNFMRKSLFPCALVILYFACLRGKQQECTGKYQTAQVFLFPAQACEIQNTKQHFAL